MLDVDTSSADLRTLSAITRQRLAHAWLARAGAELGVAAYMRTIARDLAEVSSDDGVRAMFDRLVDDEDHHARVCLTIASTYAGRPLEAPSPVDAEFVPLDRVPQPYRVSLRILGMLCIGETLAAAWMDTSRRTTEEPWLRNWIRRHYSDEVVHARVGWAHFASRAVDARVRAVAGRWVLPLAKANINGWFASADDDAGLEDHGFPNRAETRAIAREAMLGLVVPGLHAVGIDASALETAVPSLLGDEHVAG